MNRWAPTVLALALVTVVAGSAWAHEGHVHTIMGTVTGVDAHALQVKTPSGEILSIAITDKTTVVRGKQKAALADLQKGARVVVEIGNGEDPLMAGQIRLGAAPTAAKK